MGCVCERGCYRASPLLCRLFMNAVEGPAVWVEAHHLMQCAFVISAVEGEEPVSTNLDRISLDLDGVGLVGVVGAVEGYFVEHDLTFQVPARGRG